MKKEPEGQSDKQRSNVVQLRGRAGAAKGYATLAQAGLEGRREPTGEDVITMLLGCAPEGVLRDLDLGRDTSGEWASLIEWDRTTLGQKLRLHATGSPSSHAEQAEAVRARVDYARIAGLALAYTFLKPAWRKASPNARDTVRQFGVPYDVLMQFGESLRCEIEERESGILGDQEGHYSTLAVDLKAQRDSARAESEALKAAETQAKRKRSDDARKGPEARWAEDGAGGKPADKAKAKYLPRMLAWVKAHRTPEKAKNACVRNFLPMIEEEFGTDAPLEKTVRSWLQGK